MYRKLLERIKNLPPNADNNSIGKFNPLKGKTAMFFFSANFLKVLIAFVAGCIICSMIGCSTTRNIRKIEFSYENIKVGLTLNDEKRR